MRFTSREFSGALDFSRSGSFALLVKFGDRIPNRLIERHTRSTVVVHGPKRLSRRTASSKLDQSAHMPVAVPEPMVISSVFGLLCTSFKSKAAAPLSKKLFLPLIYTLVRCGASRTDPKRLCLYGCRATICITHPPALERGAPAL